MQANAPFRQEARQKLKSFFWSATYIVLMTLNFLGDLRGFPRMLKGTGIVFCVMAFFHFLINYDIKNTRYLLEFFMMLTLSVVLVISISLMIWIYDMASLEYILAGSDKVLIQAINIFAVIGGLYILKRATLRYTLYSMSLAYFVIFLKMIATYGIGGFISSFIYFLTSLGDASGAMRYMEVHDLTFAFGSYVIFYIAAPKDEPRRKLCIFLSLLGFFMGFKRIGLIGVILALAYHFYISHRKPNKRNKAMIRFCVGFIIVCWAYLFTIKYGLFDWFTETFNIDTMSRTGLYHFISDYYELTPTYRGNGLNYLYTLLVSLKDAGIDGISGITAIHNDLLRQYIELGFWGYFLWLLYELYVRPRWLLERHGFFAAEMYVLLSIYMFFTYFTDNTIYYYHSAFIYRLVPLACAQYFHQQNDDKLQAVLNNVIIKT
ncbi:MAG: O-antigen ligase family protein [Eubacteriales bacterium]|nr:O-antigen ligase family protein [Eubacteriales bacterium]